jgi:hypothetical protein
MSNSDVTYCNARLRQNGHDPGDLEKVDPSDEWAGEGYCQRQTETPRCRMHGGANTDQGRPPSHGLYSFKRTELEERFREAYSGQDWADLRAEIAAVRALLSDYLEGIEEVSSESIDDVAKLVSELRRLTSDLQKMLHRERLTRDEEQELINRFAQILRTYVPAESDRDEALDALEDAVSGGGERLALEGGE